MIRVLLTGISGTGKSTMIAELSARGYKAVDLDSDQWSEWAPVSGDEPAEWGSPVEPDRDWVWREDRVRKLLQTEDADLLFVSGCAVNQRLFRPQFDHVILLTAPREVIVQRLAMRTSNSYGKEPRERARVLELMDTVEHGLRRSSDLVIDTNEDHDVSVSRVLSFVLP